MDKIFKTLLLPQFGEKGFFALYGSEYRNAPISTYGPFFVCRFVVVSGPGQVLAESLEEAGLEAIELR